MSTHLATAVEFDKKSLSKLMRKAFIKSRLLGEEYYGFYGRSMDVHGGGD